jgi:hypothetical protein
MEAVSTFETSVYYDETTWRYIPDGCHIYVCAVLTHSEKTTSTLRHTSVLKLWQLVVSVDRSLSRCHFPTWVTEHHVWHTLDHQRSYHFSKHNATLRIAKEAGALPLNEATGGHASSDHGGGGGSSSRSGSVEMRMVCHSIVRSTEKEETIVAHVTTGW